LQLAAPTASRDLQLFVWVLGQARAVPSNWPTLELNDTRIDFFDPSPGYPALVAEAVQEAGGRGFVAEYAGSTASLASNFTLVGRAEWELFSQGGFGDNAQLIDATALIFGEWDGYEQAIRDNAPGAADVPRQELLRCPSCYIDDLEGFAQSLSRDVVEPMLVVHDQLRDAPHVTRFNARMDGRDLTLDPTFAYLRETSVESNLRRARGALRCDDRFDLELPFGNVVTGVWGRWPQADELPATRRILQYDEAGELEVLQDNRELIADVYPSPAASRPAAGESSTPDLLDAGAGGDAGVGAAPRRSPSCSGAAGRAGAHTSLALLALVLSLAAAYRLRRTRPSTGA
jgi:hypothetical protein